MKNKYYVSVDYQSTSGNPLSKSDTIEANDIEEADEILRQRVQKQKNFLKIVGGSSWLLEGEEKSTDIRIGLLCMTNERLFIETDNGISYPLYPANWDFWQKYVGEMVKFACIQKTENDILITYATVQKVIRENSDKLRAAAPEMYQRLVDHLYSLEEDQQTGYEEGIYETETTEEIENLRNFLNNIKSLPEKKIEK